MLSLFGVVFVWWGFFCFVLLVLGFFLQLLIFVKLLISASHRIGASK